jgi:hypothetical protein
LPNLTQNTLFLHFSETSGAAQSLMNYIKGAIAREKSGARGALRQGFQSLLIHGFGRVLDNLLCNSETAQNLLPLRPTLLKYQVKYD